MNLTKSNNLILLPIPILTFAVCTFLALFINNSYSIDPDYSYLFNGLNIIRGESHSIVHVDHPGTPLQLIIGLFIFITGTLRGADDLTADVLLNPQLYIKTIIISIAFFYSLVLFFIGKKYFKLQKNLAIALLLQFSFLMFAAVSITPTKLFTETIIPLGSLLIVLITIGKVWGKMNEWVYSILSGVILGVFIAIKITFLPVAIIPIIVALRWRNKLLTVLTTTAFFFISILPVIERFANFRSFMGKIATHEGAYGSGQEEILNFSKLLNNFWNTLQIEYTFGLVFSLSLIILLFAFRKNKFQFLRDRDTRVLFAIFLTFLLQLIIVSKHSGFRYMIPSLLFSAFALSIVVNQLKSYKIVVSLIIALTIFSALFYNIKMLSKAIRLSHSQNKTYSFIQSSIGAGDAVMVVTKESWFGSPFMPHSLMFGKLYCLRQGEQYNKYLEKIYPNAFFWTHNDRQYSDWYMPVMPEMLLTEYKQMYLYVHTDEPQLYSNTIDDFTKRLKFESQEPFDLNLVFSNQEMDEEIYQIQLKNHEVVLPKLTLFCDFESVADSNKNIILTSHDSITFSDGCRLNDSQSLDGKYAICISPDDPFGISTIIPSVKQYDYIHVSIYCKRNSLQQECYIGFKSFVADEGFAKLGGVSTETVNDWEKIEYSYRFTHQPAGQKVVMFIWNNSNEPMYFDDLKVELF